MAVPWRLLTGLAGALLVAACAARVPRSPEPTVTPPATFAQAGDEVVEAAAPRAAERWWELFGDPDLNAVVESVLGGNLDLETAYLRLQQLGAAARASAAQRRPTLDVEARASREHQPGVRDASDTRSYRLSLAAGYEVDLWDKLSARERAAGLDAEAASLALEAAVLSLSAQAADLYFLAVEQRAQLALTERTVASFRDSLERVEARYRAGLVPSLDVYQARQNLAAARARVPQYQQTLATTRHALAELAGLFPEADGTSARPELPEVPLLPEPGVPAALLTRRPDLQEALRRVAAADARAAAAVADRFPSLRLGGALGWSQAVLETGSPVGIFWNLLAGLTQPVLDGERRAAEVERTRAGLREASVAYRARVLRAVREVEDALAANRYAAAQIERTRERVVSSAATLRAATDRYLNGLSDYLPVLSAQAANLDARSQLLAARRRLLSERVGLVRALGGDWMGEAVERRFADAERRDQS